MTRLRSPPDTRGLFVCWFGALELHEGAIAAPVTSRLQSKICFVAAGKFPPNTSLAVETVKRLIGHSQRSSHAVIAPVRLFMPGDHAEQVVLPARWRRSRRTCRPAGSLKVRSSINRRSLYPWSGPRTRSSSDGAVRQQESCSARSGYASRLASFRSSS